MNPPATERKAQSLLPDPMFNGISQGVTFVVHNRLYRLAPSIVFADRNPVPGYDHFKIGNQLVKVMELDDLEFLEALYMKDANAQIAEFQRRYTHSDEFKSLTTADLWQDITSLKLKAYIINKVYPRFFDIRQQADISPLEDLLGQKKAGGDEEQEDDALPEAEQDSDEEFLLELLQKSTKKQKQEKGKKAEQQQQAQEPEQETLSYSRNGRSLLMTQVLGNVNTGFIDYSVWQLYEHADPSLDHVMIRGKRYYLKESDAKSTLGLVKQKYLKAIEDQLKKEALSNKKDFLLLRDVRQQVQALLTSQESKDVGLSVEDSGSSSCYLNLHVNPFILYDAHETKQYYLFPECDVAVQITINVRQGGADQIQSNSPVIRQLYRHPFLRNYVEGETICLGTWKPRQGSPDYVISQQLDMAKNIIITGYKGIAGQDFAPHHRLSRDIFKENIISKDKVDELTKKGVRVTNTR